jgi:hypothetical protein
LRFPFARPSRRLRRWVPAREGGSPLPQANRKAGAVRASARPAANQDVGRKAVIRQPDETPEQLGAHVLPVGAETITKPLEFDLPPLGKVVLVLYRLGSDDTNLVSDPSVYRGTVLVPDGKPGSYRSERLPSQKDGAATLMYEVKSVFTADADGDGTPELCVLSEISEAGSRKAHTDTDLFKWTGSSFTLVRHADKRPLYNLRDAKAARARLKKIRIP